MCYSDLIGAVKSILLLKNFLLEILLSLLEGIGSVPIAAFCILLFICIPTFWLLSEVGYCFFL